MGTIYHTLWLQISVDVLISFYLIQTHRKEADLVGSTGDMVRYVKSSSAKDFTLLTECGLTERLRVEYLEKNFLGASIQCPYMKTINLENTLQVPQSPYCEQIIEIPENILFRAKNSIKRMFELSK